MSGVMIRAKFDRKCPQLTIVYSFCLKKSDNYILMMLCCVIPFAFSSPTTSASSNSLSHSLAANEVAQQSDD